MAVNKKILMANKEGINNTKTTNEKTSVRRYNLKMILMGDGGVGKTSLVDRYVSAKFEVDYKITIGVNVLSKLVTLHEMQGESAMLAIHDLAGQQRFEGMRQSFYLGAQLVMAVFDLTRKQSLENLENIWIPELSSTNPVRKEKPPMQLLLIGNKCDLSDLRAISNEEILESLESIKDRHKQINVLDFLETSAKDNIHVEKGFYLLTKEYIKKLKMMYPDR